MKIGINGFGRIGRQAFRAAFEKQGIQVVHINDIGEPENLAYLLQRDTTYGKWKYPVRSEGAHLQINGQSISVSAEKDPSNLPWKEKQVDIVLESTGVFRKREDAQRHIHGGAKKVLVSAPGKNALDGDFIIGVNDDQYDPDRHHIISIGSCTTNCLATITKVLNREFHIEHGFINTTHAYTASQRLLDGTDKKMRRGRAAAENLVPTSTGAAVMIEQIFPELGGRINGLAVRAPVKCGSLLDLTCTVKKKVDVKEINKTFQTYAAGEMKDVLGVESELLVSGDIIGTKQSAIVSLPDTKVLGGHFVKILAWYDNEWAFSNRCVEMMQKML